MRRRQRRQRHHRHQFHPPCHAEVCLSDLEPGQRATILRVGGRGRARRRFMEMGFVRGETVLVERVAPLGDPVEFFVKGYHVSLRRQDACHIKVRKLESRSGTDR